MGRTKLLYLPYSTPLLLVTDWLTVGPEDRRGVHNRRFVSVVCDLGRIIRVTSAMLPRLMGGPRLVHLIHQKGRSRI